MLKVILERQAGPARKALEEMREGIKCHVDTMNRAMKTLEEQKANYEKHLTELRDQQLFVNFLEQQIEQLTEN